jgi:hypothetical protein
MNRRVQIYRKLQDAGVWVLQRKAAIHRAAKNQVDHAVNALGVTENVDLLPRPPLRLQFP